MRSTRSHPIGSPHGKQHEREMLVTQTAWREPSEFSADSNQRGGNPGSKIAKARAPSCAPSSAPYMCLKASTCYGISAFRKIFLYLIPSPTLPKFLAILVQFPTSFQPSSSNSLSSVSCFGFQLQVVGCGMLGRRRAAARRSMIAAATKALDWVSLEKLQPGHLKELARAIHGALVDPVVSAAQGWLSSNMENNRLTVGQKPCCTKKLVCR